MAQQNSLKIVDVSRVTPSVTDSAELTEFTLPLTFLDIFCFKFPPIQCLFFYSLPHSHETLIPNFKKSLSHTIKHYLPLAGTLTWPPESPKPYVLYKPGDGVSFTVAESSKDLFYRLTDNRIFHGTAQAQPLVPDLVVHENEASILAMQVTLFPGAGFCIGVTAHHAFLDGRSATVFMKSWAHCHVCMHENDLPPEPKPKPFFDRSVVVDPNRLENLYLNRWLDKIGSRTRMFELWPNSVADTDQDPVRGTFELSQVEIEALKALAVTKLDRARVSSFVAASSFVLTCMVRATWSEHETNAEEENRKLYFIIGVDYRARLVPPIPEEYFGNCSGSHVGNTRAKDCLGENGFADLAAKIDNLIKSLSEKGVLEGAEERLKKWGSLEPDSHVIAVTWSPRFGVYGTDFGFGRPEKFEVLSVHGKAISMVDLGGDNNGSGIEIALALNKLEMDRFAFIFRSNLSKLLAR